MPIPEVLRTPDEYTLPKDEPCTPGVGHRINHINYMLISPMYLNRFEQGDQTVARSNNSLDNRSAGCVEIGIFLFRVPMPQRTNLKHSILPNVVNQSQHTAVDYIQTGVQHRSRTSFECIVKTINCLHPIPLSRSP